MLNYYFNFLCNLLLCFILSFIGYHVSASEINKCQLDNQNYPNVINHWPTNNHKELLNSNFWLSIEEVNNLSNDILWIDVRSNVSKSENQLGMLTIHLNQLQKKDFLFNKTIVLVGSGFDQHLINRTINSLKTQGNFNNIYALSGGIRTWNKYKQYHLDEQNVITPEELVQGGKTINWQLITIGLFPSDINKLPEKPVQNFNLSQDSYSEITFFLEHNRGYPAEFINYVFITPNDNVTELLKQQLKLPSSINAVWLQGGLSAYQEYVSHQNNLINNTGKSLSSPCRLTL